MRMDLDNRIVQIRLDKMEKVLGRDFSIKIRTYARRFKTADNLEIDSNDGSVRSNRSKFSSRSRRNSLPKSRALY